MKKKSISRNFDCRGRNFEDDVNCNNFLIINIVVQKKISSLKKGEREKTREMKTIQFHGKKNWVFWSF